AKSLRDQLDALKKALDEAGDNLTDAQKQALMEGLKQLAATKGIKLTASELKDILFPDEIKKTNINSVTSMDPNAIYGNIGFGEDRYIHNSETMNYLVAFENVDTATAPAQIVKIKVNLDTNKYDIRQTLIGHVTIAGKTYFFEDD